MIRSRVAAYINRIITHRRRQVLISLFLFGLAFIPRALNLSAYVAPDEAKWILRSAHFLTALRTGDFGAAASQIATPEVDVLAPAVTTMWTGALGLLAKYEADGAPIPLSDYLAALPYANSERVSLDFYPWLRFPTVFITSLFVVVFYLLLLKLLANEKIALIAAILLALDPFFINYSRVIHHDALVTVFMTLSLLSTLLYLQHENSWWLLLSGVMLGLAVLTKPTALFLVPFIGLMWLWQCYHTRRWRRLLGWGILWAGIGLLTFVVVWPALWNDPAGTLLRLVETSLSGAAGESRETLIPTLVPNRLPELGFLYYPVNFLFSWGILPTVGLVIALVAWWRGKLSGFNTVKPVLIWLLLFSLLLMLSLVPLATRDIRYFMPAWPALITVAAFGLVQLKTWMKPWVITILSAILLIPYYPYYVSYYNPIFLGPYLAPNVIKLGGGVGLDQAAFYLNTLPDIKDKKVASYMLESFRPYFNGQVSTHKSDNFVDYTVYYVRQIQNQHPSAEHIAYFDARVPDHTVRIDGIDYAYIYLIPAPRLVYHVSFDDITLVAQTLDTYYIEPGSEHQLIMLWRASPAAASTIVQLQVRDSGGKVWLESQGPLLSPDGPSAVEGHYTLTFPREMPRGDYELWVTVDNDHNWIKFGDLPVRHLSPPEKIPYSAKVNFNNVLMLYGFDLSNREPIPGETLVLILYWQALQQMPLSYTTFVHLVDPAGNIIAQADMIPGNGAWPTTTWASGEWISDNVLLSLPSELPPGEYQLLVGWYYWETGERLPILNGDNSATTAILTSINIQ